MKVFEIELKKFIIIINQKFNHTEILGHIYSVNIYDTTNYPLTEPINKKYYKLFGS